MALINMDVFGPILRQHIEKKGKLINLAKELENVPEYTQKGSTITIVQNSYIGDAEDFTGTITPVELSQTEQQIPLRVSSKGVSVKDSDQLTNPDNLIDEAAEQLAISLVRKMEKDFREVIASDSVLKTPLSDNTSIVVGDLYNILQLFGDDIDVDMWEGIVIPSVFLPSFYAMDEFVSASKTFATEGNGVVRNGLAGFFLGIPVFVANLATMFDDGENGIIAVQKGGLAWKRKHAPKIEEERKASEQKTDLYASEYYCVCIRDVSKVALSKVTIA